MPGHAGSWCKGHPEICPSATCTQPLNVASNATFELIEDLLHQCTVRPMYPRLSPAERSREVAESPALNELQGGVASAPGKPSPGIFKDNFIHLGGVRRLTSPLLARARIDLATAAKVATAQRDRCAQDEVDTACWESTPAVAAWLKAQGMTADEGYAYVPPCHVSVARILPPLRSNDPHMTFEQQ